MKTKFSDRKRKILRRIYGGLSLTSALFIFQACYGSPQDFGYDNYVEGSVKSKTTNQPITGIKVSIENQPEYIVTDNSGLYKAFTYKGLQHKVKFEDIDLLQNGSYLPKDTVVSDFGNPVHLDVLLNDK